MRACINVTNSEDAMKRDEVRRDAYATGLALLVRREHSVLELSQKLSLRDFDPESIDAACQRLIEEDALSDARYAEQYVVFYARRGHGPVRIQQALRQKGVSDALRARAFACFFEEGGSWLQSCYAAWNKRFGCYPDGAAAYQKQQRFLSHRGFDHETIRATLSASFKEA